MFDGSFMIARLTSLSLLWIATAAFGQGAPLKVAVANGVIADILRTIGGDDIELVVLGGAQSDPHHYEPTPADAKKIADAELVVQFGLGLDVSVARLHASTESKGRLLVVAEGLGSPSGAGQNDGHQGHDHAHHAHDAHDAAVDPHIWHDPSKVQLLNARLCAALVEARPNDAEAFKARSRVFDEQLVQLDLWIKGQVQGIPSSKRVIVTTHDGLRYFAHRYGFQLVGIEMMGGGVAQTDPSPKELIKMVHALQAAKCSVVFGDSAHPSRIAATVAREANVRLIETLRLDGLLPPPAAEAGKAYLETMRANVKTIVEALHE